MAPGTVATTVVVNPNLASILLFFFFFFFFFSTAAAILSPCFVVEGNHWNRPSIRSRSTVETHGQSVVLYQSVSSRLGLDERG